MYELLLLGLTLIMHSTIIPVHIFMHSLCLKLALCPVSKVLQSSKAASPYVDITASSVHWVCTRAFSFALLRA